LERTFGLLEALGNPHHRIRTFHVAGTNGKGSVVAMLYALLRGKGLRVGRYMSPHLIDFRERIVVDEQPITEQDVLDFLRTWAPLEEKLGATFFEITTAMALHYFAAAEVDVAVIETGLGGRLDATNVITPLVSGITSISIDHQEFLGDTEELIAAEKAGIFKPGIPAVIGPVSVNSRDAIARTAARAGVAAVIDATDVYRVSDVAVSAGGTRFSVDDGERRVTVTAGIVGAAQATNAAVALAMLRAGGDEWAVSLDAAQQVLPGVRLPGRFQQLDSYILDVAHNPDGIKSLVRTLRAVKPPHPIVAVLGVLDDKDWGQMMTLLAQLVERITIVAPPSAPVQRAWDPDKALAFARRTGIPADTEPDFERAVRVAGETGGTALITGSFHTVGDALLVLGESAL